MKRFCMDHSPSDAALPRCLQQHADKHCGSFPASIYLRRASLKMSLSQRKTIFWRQNNALWEKVLPPWTRMLPTPH